MTGTQNTDAQTGNKPSDHDYEFCARVGIPTIESQARRIDWGMRKRTDVMTAYPLAGGAMASSCGE